MEIRIERTLETDFQLTKAIWKQFEKKYYLTLIVYFICGAILLLPNNQTRETVPYWNFLSATGLSLIVLALFNIKMLFDSKRKMFKGIKSKIHCNDVYTTIIELNDKGIFYKTNKFEVSYFWNSFANYQITKDMIWIFVEDGSDYPLMIEKTELTAEEFETLLDVLKVNIVRTQKVV